MPMQNVGTVDRVVRLALGLVLFWVAYRGVVGGGLGIAAYLVAVVLLVTAFARFCPAYRLFGMSTCEAGPRHAGD
jgi:hypothetical protein